MIKLRNKRAQVWVETVIYTLIGLAVIGILLAASKPKIDQVRDKLLIEQTIESLNKINAQIYEVQRAPGNKRVLDVKISKGRFFINPATDEIGWTLDSNYKYSEIGSEISLGNLEVLTEEANPYKVTLTMDYVVNLTYDGTQDAKDFEGSPSPYSLAIENKGGASGKINVDLIVR